LLKIVGVETLLISIGGGFYVREFGPSWVEISNVSLKLPRLAKSFSGLRVVQISDIHFGGWMTLEYLAEIVKLPLY